jgi:hypothetical protein
MPLSFVCQHGMASKRRHHAKWRYQVHRCISDANYHHASAYSTSGGTRDDNTARQSFCASLE